jgi:outer membrane biogenesis lipoprotein LolB
MFHRTRLLLLVIILFFSCSRNVNKIKEQVSESDNIYENEEKTAEQDLYNLNVFDIGGGIWKV